MDIEDINQELLNTLSIKEKSNLVGRLERNLRIQKILYNDEKKKHTNDYER